MVIFGVRVQSGRYAVKIRAGGFQDRKQGGISVAAGRTKDAGNIALIGTGVVPGSTPDGVPKEGPGAAASSPWYKSTWFWVGSAAVAVGGVGYLLWRQRKGR